MMQIHQEIIPNIRTVGNIIDKFSGVRLLLLEARVVFLQAEIFNKYLGLNISA